MEKNLLWKTEKEFYEIHSKDIFSRFPFYHSTMIGHSKEEFAYYIIKRAIIDKSSKVIDLGCGSGYLISILSKLCDARGISTSYENIKQCQKNYPECNFKVENMEENAGEGVSHLLALESIGYSDVRKTFKNASKILIKGGVFYIKDFSFINFHYNKAIENKESFEYFWKYNILKLQDFIKFAYDAGFKVSSIKDLYGRTNSKMAREASEYQLMKFKWPHPGVKFLQPVEMIFAKIGGGLRDVLNL
jgi:cyclopropane fatty-acyl-phospholipid synthase-like methyltransferase